MEQTGGLIGLPNIRQIYAQKHVPQLRDHIGAVILKGGYIGELQMIGRGPVGTMPLKHEYLLHFSGDSDNSAQTCLRALQKPKRTSKLKSPADLRKCYWPLTMVTVLPVGSEVLSVVPCLPPNYRGAYPPSWSNFSPYIEAGAMRVWTI